MSLEDLIKLAEQALADDDWWAFAERLVEEVPDARPRSRGGDPPLGAAAHDGSRAQLEEVSKRIEHELGHRLTVNNLRKIRATALAWPSEERYADVNYRVHENLRGEKTKPLLANYKKRAAADYERAPGFVGSPRLTEHRVRVYRADDRPFQPWDLAMAKRVKSLLRKAETPEALGSLEAIIHAALLERWKEVKGDGNS